MGGETGCARAQHSRQSDGQKRCCIIFGNVFFFLSNTLIKNENYYFFKLVIYGLYGLSPVAYQGFVRKSGQKSTEKCYKKMCLRTLNHVCICFSE